MTHWKGILEWCNERQEVAASRGSVDGRRIVMVEGRESHNLRKLYG